MKVDLVAIEVSAMPISLKYPLQKLSQDDFHQLDYRVMRTAFDIHNEFGRFLEEIVYKNELVHRLSRQGINAEREFPVELSFEAFYAKRFVDVLVERAAVYEVKSASALSPAHRNQALNYLFLTDTRHGKLINFRPSSVESEFVSTTLDQTQRKLVEIRTDGWLDEDRSATLKDHAVQLLHDWGAFLDVTLYREALSYLLDGPAHQEKLVSLEYCGRKIGAQQVKLLNPRSMWSLTATKDPQSMRDHFLRFLNLTPLEQLYWINVNRHQIEFVTLSRSPCSSSK